MDIYHHKVLAFVDGKKIPIPFNFNTLYKVFPEILARRIEDKLLDNYEYGARIPILELKKTEDNDLRFLANFIYEKIFMNYTLKQWGMKPEEIDPEVTARVPIILSKDNRYFYDKYQGVPKFGYTQMFERMIEHQNIKILFNTHFKEVLKIDVQNKRVYFYDQEFKGKVIFTGMIDELFDYNFGDLPYRSLKLGLETIEKEYFQKVAVINYPNDYDFTRITEFKHIHPTESKITTILKEYPQKYKVGDNIPYYPIFTKDNRNKYDKYKDIADSFDNLTLLGRLAEYKYYDMDDIIKRALDIFEMRIK
jgi:UDP-galactopyranose mutase